MGMLEKTTPAAPATTYLGQVSSQVAPAPAVFVGSGPPTTAVQVTQGAPQYVPAMATPATTFTTRDPVMYTGPAVEPPAVGFLAPAPAVYLPTTTAAQPAVTTAETIQYEPTTVYAPAAA